MCKAVHMASSPGLASSDHLSHSSSSNIAFEARSQSSHLRCYFIGWKTSSPQRSGTPTLLSVLKLNCENELKYSQTLWGGHDTQILPDGRSRASVCNGR